MTAILDGRAQTRTLSDGSVEPLPWVPSDLVVFELEGGHRAMLRPSGTEPKLKYYYDACERVADGEAPADALTRAAQTLDAIEGDLAAALA